MKDGVPIADLIRYERWVVWHLMPDIETAVLSAASFGSGGSPREAAMAVHWELLDQGIKLE